MTHSYGNPITWNTQRRRRGRFIVYCCDVPSQVLYTRSYHVEATATAVSASERKEEDVMVLLSFIWFPMDNTLLLS